MSNLRTKDDPTNLSEFIHLKLSGCGSFKRCFGGAIQGSERAQQTLNFQHEKCDMSMDAPSAQRGSRWQNPTSTAVRDPFPPSCHTQEEQDFQDLCWIIWEV